MCHRLRNQVSGYIDFLHDGRPGATLLGLQTRHEESPPPSSSPLPCALLDRPSGLWTSIRDEGTNRDVGTDMADVLEVFEALSQVFRPRAQLVSAAAGLVFASSLSAGERSTDEDPPEWDKRDEGWTIDGLLGLYVAEKREITIFTKGIAHAAAQLGTTPGRLEYVVRLHEWGHAVFHLGVDQGTSFELAKAGLANDPSVERLTAQKLTETYRSVDDHVHEQIAQALTKLALDELSRKATIEDAKAACSRLSDTFEALMRRQPPAYQLDKLGHLGREQLQRRVSDVIGLVRGAKLGADRKTWDTLMSW